MKKAFVGVGIGVMVVTGLIQSGVVDVNQVSTTGDFASSGHPIGKTMDENSSEKVNPLESSYETRQPDTTIKPFNGTLKIAQKKQQKNNSHCIKQVAEISFSPSSETFSNKPLLAKVTQGEYLVKIGGTRKQWFLVNGKVTNYRLVDADGKMIDETPSKQWFTKDSLIPKKPYGGIVLHVDEEIMYIGESYKFMIKKDDAEIHLDINVFQHPDNYTSTESTMKAKLFECI